MPGDQKALCKPLRITITITSRKIYAFEEAVDTVRTCYGDANGAWIAMGRGLKQRPVGSAPLSFRLLRGRFTIPLPPLLPHPENFGSLSPLISRF